MELFPLFDLLFLGTLMGVREVSMRRGVTETRKGRPGIIKQESEFLQ